MIRPSREQRESDAIKESRKPKREIAELIQSIEQFLVDHNITNTKVIHCKNVEIFPADKSIRTPKVGFNYKRKQIEFYDRVKSKYNLTKRGDIVWLKFTKDGHIVSVAKGYDFNFRYRNTSGSLVIATGKKLDNTHLIYIPLPKLGDKIKATQIEHLLGEYLVNKGYPMIDKHSHKF